MTETLLVVCFLILYAIHLVVGLLDKILVEVRHMSATLDRAQALQIEEHSALHDNYLGPK